MSIVQFNCWDSSTKYLHAALTDQLNYTLTKLHNIVLMYTKVNMFVNSSRNLF